MEQFLLINIDIQSCFGFSTLRFDQKFLGKKTGGRKGQQAFTSLNFRTKKTYGNLNLTPIGQI